MNRTFSACFAAVLIAASTTPAFAETLYLTFARGDLQSAEGREGAYAKMVKASTEFCQLQSRKSFKAFTEEKECIADMTAQFVASSKNADLAVLHNARTPSPAEIHR